MSEQVDDPENMALVAVAEITAQLAHVEQQPKPPVESGVVAKAAYAADQVRQYRALTRQLKAALDRALDEMVAELGE